MPSSRVKFAGSAQGLRMRLAWEVPLPQLLVELEEHLQKARDFFQGARVLVEVGERGVATAELEQLAVVLERYGVLLGGVVPASASAERRVEAPVAPPPVAASLHLERRTVRSGEKIATAGHLVILGDVNPGAEVMAGHHIIVWGALRGSAYAGIPDREDAVIAALHLAPIQLRIAGYIARPPEHRPPWPPVPELARIDGTRIVVEAWERGRALPKGGRLWLDA
ncbi:MAG: putative septum site-determining protein MinC [Candidatus Tectimicrobiota bacterium]|nr:MAG: putative septum site-determining protein MinC [Candidatus Tectomicrobia bacterium]